jgi:hypothetical protein
MSLHSAGNALRADAAARHTHTHVCLVLDLRVGDLIRFRWRDDTRLLEGRIHTEPCGSQERRDGHRPRAIDSGHGRYIEPVLPGRERVDVQLAGHLAYCGVPLAWCLLPAAAEVPLFDESLSSLASLEKAAAR